MSSVNTGGVQLNTLADSQHRQAGISFALRVCVSVSKSEKAIESRRKTMRPTRTVCVCAPGAFVWIIHLCMCVFV